MLNSLEVEIKRSYYVRMIVLGILSLGIGFILFGLEYIRWARSFDPGGVTRIDGKKFSWSDLKEKRRVNMRNLPNAPLNHLELIFTDGKALIFPLMLENAAQVMDYVEKLPVQKSPTA